MNCRVSDGEGVSGVWFWLGEPIMHRMTLWCGECMGIAIMVWLSPGVWR